jgi:hypothetical protein
VRDDLVRSAGPVLQTSKFTNELQFLSFTDEFFTAPPDARRQILQHDMRQTNYAGVTPGMLDYAVRQMYSERLTVATAANDHHDVTAAQTDGDEVVLTPSAGWAGDRTAAPIWCCWAPASGRPPPIVRQLADVAGGPKSRSAGPTGCSPRPR